MATAQGVQIHMDDHGELRRLGQKLKRRVNADLRKRMNRAVKPLTANVKAHAWEYMPDRYAEVLAKSLRVTVRVRGSSTKATMSIVGSANTNSPKGRSKRELARLDRGQLRHPLYGNRGYWYGQAIWPGFWSDPAGESVAKAQDDIVRILDEFKQDLRKGLK